MPARSQYRPAACVKVDTMKLPFDEMSASVTPASPLVEATLSLVHDVVRTRFKQAGTSWAEFSANGDVAPVSEADLASVDARILASGYRYAWSAGISVHERPDAYKAPPGAAHEDMGFQHPNAPNEPADSEGRAVRGIGDNVVRHERDLTGIARYIRTNEQVLGYLTAGVPEGTIAVIEDSGGTLTAPIIERFAGVICAGGTVRSHLGILTREYNIPCLMNARLAGIKDGDRIAIEVSAAAKTTEDYQLNRERVARIWLMNR